MKNKLIYFGLFIFCSIPAMAGINTLGDSNQTDIEVDDQLPTFAAARSLTGWFTSIADCSLTEYGMTTSSHGCYVQIKNSVISLTNQQNGSAALTGVKNVVDGNYHMFAMTYDGTNGALYIDGKLESSGTYTLNTPATGFWIIGSDLLLAPLNIANVRAYNRSLLPQEISYLYKFPSYAVINDGLLAWYKLDEFKYGYAGIKGVQLTPVIDSSKFRSKRAAVVVNGAGFASQSSPPLVYP